MTSSYGQTQPDPWSQGEGFGTPRPDAPIQQQSNARPTAYDQPQPGEGWANNPSPRYVDGAGAAEPTGLAPAQFPGAAVYQPTPLQAAPGSPYYGFSQAPDHPNATASLVLGIVGIVMLFMGLPIASPVAWWMAAKTRREMRANPGRWRDSPSVTVGLVLGVVGTVALALIGLAVLIVVLLMMATGG